MNTPVIMWFRNDLRLSDNRALNAALRSGSPVIPLFILDRNILDGDRTGVPRTNFLREALVSLDRSLQAQGGKLLVGEGRPEAFIPRLIQESGATALYFNRDYSPYALRRDAAVAAAVPVPVHRFDDRLLVAPGDVMKADGSPYTVFTPFKRQWLTLPKPAPEPEPHDGAHLVSIQDRLPLALITLDVLGIGATFTVPDASEREAQRRLRDFVSGPNHDYERGRNRLSANTDDAVPGTSCLSAYFHLGILSVRAAYQAALDAGQQAADDAARQSVDTWIGELAWREFYQHILFHFPHVVTKSFRPDYDRLEWRDSPDDLQAWKAEQTGYPIVDTAMRQLRQTGWMPNRARMIVASFLTRHLLIDWREGERHFMRWLIDGDVAANNGGWQWAAGTGTDAQPYFRIFNPELQGRKFDPDGAYIRRWVPELRAVEAAALHAPWELSQPPTGYPPPIVDHAFARQRALNAYRMLKRNQWPEE